MLRLREVLGLVASVVGALLFSALVLSVDCPEAFAQQLTGTRPLQVWNQQCIGNTGITAQYFIHTKGIQDSFGQQITPPKLYTFNITCYSYPGVESRYTSNNFPAIPWEAGNVDYIAVHAVVTNKATRETTTESFSTSSVIMSHGVSQGSVQGGDGNFLVAVPDVFANQ